MPDRLSNIISPHPTTRFNLCDQPWLPMAGPDGTVMEMSLKDAFAASGTMKLAADDPLEAHALIRFLIALTYLAYAYNPDGKWEMAAKGAGPLPLDGIERALSRLYPYANLFDPDQPFLQQPTLPLYMSAPTGKNPTAFDGTKDFAILLPHLPSGSNAAWFNRETHYCPSDAAVVRALLIRHFCGLPGNETPNSIAGGMRTNGGIAALTSYGRSYAWYEGNTLAQTLACNLLTNWTNEISPTNVLFWEDPNNPVAHLKDKLWLSTATTNATLLVEVEGKIRVIASPALIPADVAKHLSGQITAHDPHTVRVDADNPTGTSYVTFSTHLHQHAMMRLFYDKIGADPKIQQPCLLQADALRFGREVKRRCRVRLTNVAAAGTSTGPLVAAVVTELMDADVLLLDSIRAAALRVCLDRVSGQNRSALSLTTWHAQQALGVGNKSASGNAIRHVVETRLWNDLEPVIAELVGQIRTADPPPGELDEHQQRALIEAAMRAYDEVTQVVAAHPRHRTDVLRHRVNLRSTLWTR